jgi:two-component system osmolarity sensor histidine kinase EnvZ
MTEALQRAEAERVLLLAGVSHDLRTPLSRMRLAIEMLGAGDRAITDGMVQDIEDMDAIIDQFLDFARADGGEAVEPQGDLNALIAEVVDRYARDGKAVNASCDELPPVPLRPMAIKRLVINLVENALRYAGTAVEIQVRRHGDRAVIAVLDRGPGIPVADANRMLQPFTRLESSRGGAKGAGLGLAIVQRIAAMHRGDVGLHARAGGGLEVRVTLPLTSSEQSTPRRAG